jgi:hypothetical protein
MVVSWCTQDTEPADQGTFTGFAERFHPPAEFLNWQRLTTQQPGLTNVVSYNRMVFKNDFGYSD